MKPSGGRPPRRDEGAPGPTKRQGKSRPSRRDDGAADPTKRQGKSRPSRRDDSTPDPRKREGTPRPPRREDDRGDNRGDDAPRSKSKKNVVRPRRPVGPVGSGGKGGVVPATNEGPMRVQRALARAGVTSRRGADQAVADGRVTVNGVVAVIGQSVDPAHDILALDGEKVRMAVASHRWIVINKPAGVVTTRRDPQSRRTVFDLVEDVPGLVYVGRLDFMTEGVLLMTTDGRAVHALTHPSSEVERTYLVTVQGDAVTAAREARKGVELDDGMVVPRDVKAHPLGQRRWGFEITITEGKTHEVRRICETLGLEVERLVRTRFGPVSLGELESGATRALTAAERTMLEAITGSS